MGFMKIIMFLLKHFKLRQSGAPLASALRVASKTMLTMKTFHSLTVSRQNQTNQIFQAFHPKKSRSQNNGA